MNILINIIGVLLLLILSKIIAKLNHITEEVEGLRIENQHLNDIITELVERLPKEEKEEGEDKNE